MTYTQTSNDVRVTGRRVVATLIDGVILGAVAGLFTALFGETVSMSGFQYTSLGTGGSFAFFLIVLAYYIVLEGMMGRTVGKMVTGIRVVTQESGATPPGFGKAAIRTLLRIVDGFLGFLVGFIIVLANDNRQRLGDLAAKTLVVRA